MLKRDPMYCSCRNHYMSEAFQGEIKMTIKQGIPMMLLFVFLCVTSLIHIAEEYSMATDFGQTENKDNGDIDQILAEDLALTSSLFIQQVTSQLQHLTHMIGDQQINQDELNLLAEQLEEKLNEHRHFNSFALVQEGTVLYASDSFPRQQLEQFDLEMHDTNRILYSNPFSTEGQQSMLVSCLAQDQLWAVGEVNLTFMKDFVGELASVVDAEGNFFISGDNGLDKDVNWQAKGLPEDGRAHATVPELDWQIIIHSEDKGESEDIENDKARGIVVHFYDATSATKWLNNHSSYQVLKSNGTYYVLNHPEQTLDEMLHDLRKAQEVRYAEPNVRFEKQISIPQTVLPNDEFYKGYQWNLQQIHAPEGWAYTEGTEDVIIAILDTGIDMEHEDLQNKLVSGYNAFDESDDANDEHGHGTHVAGIASALTNNEAGIAGISWNNRLMPVKVLDATGEGDLFEIIQGIEWATDHGASIINMSLGDWHNSELLHDAVRYAYDQDVVMIAATGNENSATPMYPAAYQEVMAVSAVDEHNIKSNFSNYGLYVDVTAPGEHIPSAIPDNQYAFMSGTSMAAPHVAGLAGLIRSLRPELTNEHVMKIITRTADNLGDVGHDVLHGYGLINIEKALQETHNYDAQGNTQASERKSEGHDPVIRTDTRNDRGPIYQLIKWVYYGNKASIVEKNVLKMH